MILRICVVIPTYNNARTVSEAVKDVLLNTSFPVLVVDDGSDTPVSGALYSWDVRNALETGRVRVERFEKNRGKGAALRFAIKELARQGYTHMMAMDADGQHFAREIHKLVELAKAHPWDLIIGERKLKSETVPTISKFGRKFSNFWVNYETGSQIRDSQSGFRLYPLLPVQNMRFLSRKYDFEIEVLIRLLWKGVHVREVEIDVYYPEKEARVSHFNKFWDNVRISVLNALLVTVSLLRTHATPRELANGLAAGVLVGCTPFYGFHTLIVVGVALLLRLNVIVMWIGSHVSTPIFAPFLIYAEIYVGKAWLGIGTDAGAKGEFTAWLAGSGVVGLGLSAITWVTAYLGSLYAGRRKKRSNWNGRTRGGRLGNGILKAVLQRMGLQWGYFCLYFIVPYFYLFAPKSLRGMNEYWRLVDPSLGWWARQKKIAHHYLRFGQVLMDRVYQGFYQEKKFTGHSHGMENILAAREGGEGLILLSAHAGAWDLAASLLSLKSVQDNVSVVEFQNAGLTFQKVKGKDLQAVRSHNSAAPEDAIFSIHQALKRGGNVALMGDRPLADRFELIPFFGRLAPFDMTAFRVAAATRTKLLFTFGFKAAGDNYDFYARPSKLYAFNNDEPRELQCYQWACEYVREVEGLVRLYPDQWFNFYPFWSALPSAPSGELGAQSNNHIVEDLRTPQALKPVTALEPKPGDAEEFQPSPMR